MGVNGLWDILVPAGKSRSLVHLSVVDGFERNDSNKRAYRVGVDASIWYKHATYSKEGDNPELRLLFFRVKELAKLPILPLFVFDGRDRPKVKRGSRVGKSGSHDLSKNMKTLLEAFGMEWREAAGEVEAELAYLNRTGVIDAILTDDVDAFVFGATTIIRNTRSSNKTNADKHHVMEYRAATLRSHPQVGMTQGGMILFALLAGGDYDKGVDRFGKAVAHALARCGFGDELLEVARRRKVQDTRNFLPGWRHRINKELRENSKGFLTRSCPGLSLPDDFSDLEVLTKYVEPVVKTGGMRGNLELNLAQTAGFCDRFLKWKKHEIIERFRNLLWEPSVMRVLRRAALEQDRRDVNARITSGTMDYHVRGVPRPAAHESVGTSVSLISKYLNPSAVDRRSEAFVNQGPSITSQAANDPKSFIIKIHSSRKHISTDELLEYRLEVDPSKFMELTLSGIKDTRQGAGNGSVVDKNSTNGNEEVDEGVFVGDKGKAQKNKAPPNPLGTFRMWCPASMLLRIDPKLVEDYELGLEEKEQKKAKRGVGGRTSSAGMGKGKRKAVCSEGETDVSADEEDNSIRYSPPTKKKRVAPVPPSRCKAFSREDPSCDILDPSRIPQSRSSSSILSNVSISSEPSVSSRLSRKTSNESSPRSPLPQFSSSLPPHVHLSQSASSTSPKSADDWDWGDSSIFIYQIADPCDPDLVDRDDLRISTCRGRLNDLTWSWADLSSDGGYDAITPEDEDDLGSYDDNMDRLFQQDFKRKAWETQNTKLESGKQQKADGGTTSLGKGKASVGRRCSDGAAPAMFKTSASATKSLQGSSMTSVLSRASSGARIPAQASGSRTTAQSPMLTPLSVPRSPDSEQERPLFLPSPSPPPASSQAGRPLWRLSSDLSDVIELASSDEEPSCPSGVTLPTPLPSQTGLRKGRDRHRPGTRSETQGSTIGTLNDEDIIVLA
ncbi:hypothetical protein M0805_006400 [Coniferiporia weirii]|nr:hypothetical protein M0805_006400 [Coniferiporia weirii]